MLNASFWNGYFYAIPLLRIESYLQDRPYVPRAEIRTQVGQSRGRDLKPPHLSVDHRTYCILLKKDYYLLPGGAIVDRVF